LRFSGVQVMKNQMWGVFENVKKNRPTHVLGLLQHNLSQTTIKPGGNNNWCQKFVTKFVKKFGSSFWQNPRWIESENSKKLQTTALPTESFYCST
jgi:hypothetical protein